MPESAWSDDSLRLLCERLAAPLPPRPEPEPPPPGPDPLAVARGMALAFQAAVVTRDYSRSARLTRKVTREQAIALAVVLAEAIGLDATNLRLVTLASDEDEEGTAA
jgi:hypothetical protein